MNGKRIWVLMKIILALIIGISISIKADSYFFILLGFAIAFGFQNFLNTMEGWISTGFKFGAACSFLGGMGVLIGTIVGVAGAGLIGIFFSGILGIINAAMEILGAIFNTDVESYKVKVPECEEKKSAMDDLGVYAPELNQIHMNDGTVYTINEDTNMVTDSNGNVSYFSPEEQCVYMSDGKVIHLNANTGTASINDF